VGSMNMYAVRAKDQGDQTQPGSMPASYGTCWTALCRPLKTCALKLLFQAVTELLAVNLAPEQP